MRGILLARASVALVFLVATAEVQAGKLFPWVKPKTHYGPQCPPRTLTELAEQVTDLENRMREFGSITCKEPDVWGETNLMNFIQEYDTELRKDLASFKETIQGLIVTSDIASLASQTALGLGQTPDGGPLQPDAKLIEIQDPGKLTAFEQLTKFAPNEKLSSLGLQVEPTELTRQHSVYVKVNQQLRRTNMGDDNSRRAGYALYLLRFPISLLPGRETYAGHTGVVTLRAHLFIDSNHLRFTFPKLVAADIGAEFGPTLRSFCRCCAMTPGNPCAPAPATGQGFRPQVVEGYGVVATTPNQRLFNQLSEQHELFTKEAVDALCRLTSFDLQLGVVGDCMEADVRTYLFDRFTQIYLRLRDLGFFNEGSEAIEILSEAQLAIATGQRGQLVALKARWDQLVQQAAPENAFAVHAPPVSGNAPGRLFAARRAAHQEQVPLGEPAPADASPACAADCAAPPHWSEVSWILAVQMALVNQHIGELVATLGGESNANVSTAQIATMTPRFYALDGSAYAEAATVWSAMIEERFPIHVFTVDPIIEEQNFVDASSRVRQLQIAVAIALANGQVNANQAIRFTRTISREMAAIGLNRTVVGFAHANDTFGWYFYPRLQSAPPEASNIAAMARLVWSGGPTWRYDARHQRLEPGIRECEVLVAMPGFVNGLTFEMSTNWEKLARPGVITRDYVEMIDQGAQIQQALATMSRVCPGGGYRPSDYAVLASRVEQLEKMLPLQQLVARVPFEYDFPATQLFDTGNAHLRPTITGFYGLESIAGGEEADLFITGANFHPTQTRVIVAGGEAGFPCQVQVMSRELLKVRVPRGFKDFAVKRIPDAPLPECVAETAKPAADSEQIWTEIRVATPAGVSNGLRINLQTAVKKPDGYEVKKANPCGSGGGGESKTATPGCTQTVTMSPTIELAQPKSVVSSPCKPTPKTDSAQTPDTILVSPAEPPIEAELEHPLGPGLELPMNP